MRFKEQFPAAERANRPLSDDKGFSPTGKPRGTSAVRVRQRRSASPCRTCRLPAGIVDAGSGNLSVLLGNGDGTFQAPQVHSIGRIPNSVVIADFDGDGVTDFLYLEFDGVFLLKGSPGGKFEVPMVIAMQSPLPTHFD